MENTYSHPRAPARAAMARATRSPAIARTDGELIRVSMRDPEQFTELFQRHWERLYRFCLHRAGAVGEDLAAETFRVAFDRRARYDLRYSDARPWLFGIASNLLRDHFRSARREESSLERTAALERPPGDDAELGELERRLLGPELSLALQGLPAADRDVLLLLAWADLDYEQIALALHIPLGTVRSRIHRARRRVREQLDAGGAALTDTNEASR